LDPATAKAAIGAVRAFSDLPIEFHGHNDLGLATANTLAALEAGAEAASVTVLGLGERAGNAPLEQIAVSLDSLYGAASHRIYLPALRDVADVVARAGGLEISRFQPLVGKDVFTHESGIHVDGLIKSSESYEGIAPSLLGRKHTFVLGKHSGRAGLRHELEQLGLELTEDEELVLLSWIKTHAERHKSVVPPYALIRHAAALIDDRMARLGENSNATRRRFKASRLDELSAV
jgi:homocitrate synthase NifV